MADIAASVASIGDSAKFVVFSACPLALGAVARELDRTGMRYYYSSVSIELLNLCAVFM
jgi:hypothetical protein